MTTKPPLGLYPEQFWLETRIADIDQAILRYLHATKPVPEEWNRERTRHIDRIKDLKLLKE